MKKSDYKKLERVAELYRKAEGLLEDVYGSVEEHDFEYIECGGLEKVRLSTETILQDFLLDARNTRMWIERRTKLIKEQLMDG